MRFRVRRLAKWAGLTCCVATLAAWATTLPILAPHYRMAGFRGASRCYWIGNGQIVLGQRPTGMGEPGIYAVSWPARNWPWDVRFGLFSPSFGLPNGALVLPLWLVFTVVCVVTAFLFWRDRRRIQAGHCQRCGYDLRMNASGQCPECGLKIAGQSTIKTSATDAGSATEQKA